MKKRERAALVDIFRDLVARQAETLAAIQAEDYPTAQMGAAEDLDRLRRLLNWAIGAPGSRALDYFEGERRDTESQ